MTKHTPGPWTVDEKGVITGAAHSCISVATVPLWQWEQCKKRVMTNDDVLSFVQTNYQIAKANAALIACSPELLAALEALLHEPMAERSVDMAKRAIAKAKGGA